MDFKIISAENATAYVEAAGSPHNEGPHCSHHPQNTNIGQGEGWRGYPVLRLHAANVAAKVAPPRCGDATISSTNPLVRQFLASPRVHINLVQAIPFHCPYPAPAGVDYVPRHSIPFLYPFHGSAFVGPYFHNPPPTRHSSRSLSKSRSQLPRSAVPATTALYRLELQGKQHALPEGVWQAQGAHGGVLTRRVRKVGGFTS